MYQDYRERGVKFYYVYKALAHPERDGFVQPQTLEERLMHIEEADRRLQTDWTWLADAPDNQVKTAFGNRNNSEFVIDPEGKIVRARMWSSESELREDLAAMVGPVESRTMVADLDRETLPAERDAEIARNVVDRVQMPEGAKAVQVTAEGESPLYLKLRVEADSSLLRTGTGVARFGFWLDPIHQVHWNNLAEPLKFRFIEQDGTTFEPAMASAPKVEVESDSDPREFLVNISGAERNTPIRLEVSYFPCHDVEKWCKAATQQFVVQLEEDRHAGRPQSQMGGRGGKGGTSGKGKGRPDPERFMAKADLNKDGKIAKSEAEGKMLERFDQMDLDKDGFVTLEEMKRRFSNR